MAATVLVGHMVSSAIVSKAGWYRGFIWAVSTSVVSICSVGGVAPDGSSRDADADGTRTDGVGWDDISVDVGDVNVCDVGVVGVHVDGDAGVEVDVDDGADADVIDVRDGDAGDGDGQTEGALSDGAGGGMRSLAGTGEAGG